MFQPPPEALLLNTWAGDPVEFSNNVSYVCESEDTYFEWDMEMTEFNVTCLEGGLWSEPEVWPICLPCELTIAAKVFHPIICKF